MTFFKRAITDVYSVSPYSQLYMGGESLSGGRVKHYLFKEFGASATWNLTVSDSNNSTSLELMNGSGSVFHDDISIYVNNALTFNINNTDENNSITAMSSGVCVYHKTDAVSQPPGNQVVGELVSVDAGDTLSLASLVSQNYYEAIIPTIIHEGAVDIVATNGYETLTRETIDDTNKIDTITPLRNHYGASGWYEIKNNEATAKLIGYCGLLTSDYYIPE